MSEHHSSREEINTVSARIKQEVGDVTILVNNAGTFNLKSFTECREDEFMRTIRVNLFANYWVFKSILVLGVDCVFSKSTSKKSTSKKSTFLFLSRRIFSENR